MTPDIILAIGACAGIGIAALRISESVAQRRDAADEQRHERRLDEESIDRAVADARAIIRDEVSEARGLPMDDDDVRPLHWREAAEFRWISARLDQDPTS